MTVRFRQWYWLLLLLPIAAGLARLRFDVDVLNLLPSDIPAVQGLKIYQEHFANARELIVAVQGPSPDAAEAAARAIAESLAQQKDLVSQATWQPPWLEHPGEAAGFLAYLWFNQPPPIFSQLTNRLSPGGAAAAIARARQRLAVSFSPTEVAQLSYDPFGLTELPKSVAGNAPDFTGGQELFASADGMFRIVLVQANTDLRTYRECIRWLDRVKAVVREARHRPGFPTKIEVHYTGRPAFVAEASSGMQTDMTKSVGTTVLVILLLFWWAHRRWRPLLWLLTLLACVLVGALGIGGLVFRTINVVSVGFAAILLGLAVDYGMVLYQEALHEREATAAQVRRTIGPSIVWSAVTTAGAFALLYLSGLPGLAQLGSLVAIGIALAAIVMLSAFLPPLMAGRRHLRDHGATPASASRIRLDVSNPVVIWMTTAALVLAMILVLSSGLPRLDHSAAALRPAHSEAYSTLDEVQNRIGHARGSWWLVVAGSTETEVSRELAQVQATLEQAESNHVVDSFNLPISLWPNPEFQAANRSTARQLAHDETVLARAAETGGFTSNSIALAEYMLRTWRRAATSTNVFWPSDAVSEWVLGKLAARPRDNFYALGLIDPATNILGGSFVAAQLESALPRHDVWLAGWDRLGSSLLGVVKRDFWHVMLPMFVLLLFSLYLAFKRMAEVLLSLASLTFSFLCLLALMKLAGWSWNLLNLMAVPLLLGAGVDYSIHMQLALRRHHGCITTTRRTVGRALLLCAGTTVAGFGSNIWSGNRGLVSLGEVCAAGIACAYLSANYLLPVWWRTLGGLNSEQTLDSSSLTSASSFYRSGFWRLGLWLARALPREICAWIGRGFARAYCGLARHRREVVIQNLLPVMHHDRTKASRTARALFRQFALKLVDLWRFESGLPVDDLLGESSGWDHFSRARAEGRGILLLTLHLGNWELGAAWLAQKGVPLTVITLAEPGRGLTELRRASRARRKIETLVIGDDSFGFVEVIRRLESGATVALLIDRPPPATVITADFFGRPFAASVAPAELARASGCVLLPVYLPREDKAYSAHILPPIAYERAALRDRQARFDLTQNILQAFEPVVSEYPDQWFHFVPIWPKQIP